MTNRDKGLSYVLDRFRPEDAPGVVELFKAVYGDGYPIRLFYDAQALIEANKTGQYITVVARLPEGRVISVHHFYRSGPYELLYEFGVGLTLPDYRGAGVSNALGKYAFKSILPDLNTEEAFGEPVCYHLHMQKLCETSGYIETAIEVALMPAEAYAREEISGGRVATTVAFRCLKPSPHTVYVPQTYAELITSLYSVLDDSRELLPSSQGFPKALPTVSRVQLFDFAQVARIAVEQAGADLESHLAKVEDDAREKGFLVFQAWLKLSCPWVGQAVKLLNKHGYFIGGILPRWFDQDGLLMQKLFCPPYFDDIHLYSDRTKKILAAVQEDWNRVTRQSSSPGGGPSGGGKFLKPLRGRQGGSSVDRPAPPALEKA